MPSAASPTALRDVEAHTWFERRLRVLANREGADVPDAEWVRAPDVIADEAMAAAEESMLRSDGAPARAVLTSMAGWTAGYLATMLALGVVRDGVLLRTSRAEGLELLRAPEGWLLDLRMRSAPIAVGAGHPWAGHRDVEVVEELAEAFHAEVTLTCDPWIRGLAQRSGRGARGLWAQVADSLSLVVAGLAEAQPSVGLGAALSATEELLTAPGAPWKQRPRLWLAETAGGPVVVAHRGSCCLWYRADRTLAEASEPDDHEPDPEWEARFGDGGVNYCQTCLFRSPKDVEARVVFCAERAE